MNIVEAVQGMMQRPGWVAVLPGRHFMVISSGGMLTRMGHDPRNAVTRLSASDALAITWELWTPAQLEEMAKQAEQEA